MSPYLKSKLMPSLITATRTNSGVSEDRQEEKGNESAGLVAAAEDILRAISQNDSIHLALALRNFFDIADSQPHVEGPHINQGEE